MVWVSHGKGELFFLGGGVKNEQDSRLLFCEVSPALFL